jgi:hypothetical protein
VPLLAVLKEDWGGAAMTPPLQPPDDLHPQTAERWIGLGITPPNLKLSDRDLSFENQFIERCGSISPHARSKDLNETPAILRVLTNLFLILHLRRAPRAEPTFAKPDKFVFILWFHKVCDFRVRYVPILSLANPARNYNGA